MEGLRMKKYKVTVELREKEKPYTGSYENIIVIVEAEKEEDVPKLVLEKINIPDNKIYWEMCWIESF